MFIFLTIILFFAKYLLLAAVGIFMYVDLEMTKNVSSSVYSLYLTFSCLTFFSLLFFMLGKRILWLIVFLACGSIYVGMYNKAPEISEIHQQSFFSEQNLKDTAGNVKQIYKIWKMFN